MCLKTVFAGLTVACLLTPAWGQIVGGINMGAGAEDLRVDGDDYDPPCEFDETLPLDSFWNGNSSASAFYALGRGAVLDTVCSGFNTTGASAPNFLAWNCNAINGDGTIPVLPQLIAYTGGSVTTVSIDVGTGLDVGTATLVALDAGFAVLDADSVPVGTASPDALRTLATDAPGTAFSFLLGPCTLVADNLRFN